MWGGREIAGLVLASLVAGLATTPYAAYHFHRVAPYGVLANLLAMPVVSVVVMPMGLLGVLTMPFGFDAVFWRLMGAGIDWMIGVAQWVTSLPGSVGHMAAFDVGPLIVVTLGLLLICLLRTPLRWSGAVLVVVAGLWALNAPRPDVLLSGDGQVAAVRGGDGRLTFLHTGRDRFAVKDWLAADGDPRDARDKSLTDGVRCDAIGCTAKLADGRLVAFAGEAEAFEEDCARAAVVVSPRENPLRRDGDTDGGCKALLIDRPAWRSHGATALYGAGQGAPFEQRVAHPAGFDRPWARAYRAPQQRRRHPSTPDATPKVEDLEAGD